MANIHMHIDNFDVQENWERTYSIEVWFHGIIRSEICCLYQHFLIFNPKIWLVSHM